MFFKTTDTMKQGLEQWLKAHNQVNTLMRVNGAWDFMAEACFTTIHALETFTEAISKEFEGVQCSVQYILEDLKREGFVPEGDEQKKDG